MKRLLPKIVGAGLCVFSLSGFADTVSPEVFSTTLGVGESVTITKTVTVEESISAGVVDVMFLIDTSGSMGAEINQAKAAAAGILSSLSSFGDVSTGVGYYSEPGSVGVLHDLTTDGAQAAANINSISLGLGGGGGDFPEEGINGTYEAATYASWRPGSSRFIVALGDATFKESDGITLENAQNALIDNNVTFIGIDYGGMTNTFSGISAETLASISGGSIISSSGLNPDDLVADITSGISDSFAEYGSVTLDDFDSGLPGVATSVTCVSADIGSCVGAEAVGAFDRSVERSFEFEVTFTALAEGDYDFTTSALVDGGIVALEYDSISISETGDVGEVSAVPLPASVWMFSFGLAGVGFMRKFSRKKKIA